MRKAELNITGAYMIVYSILGAGVALVEPETAGLLGGVMYYIVRHETDPDNSDLADLLKVLFMGYLGAWFSINIIANEFTSLSSDLIHVISFMLGFMAYDIFMAWGDSSKSISSLFFKVIRGIISDKVIKWVK